MTDKPSCKTCPHYQYRVVETEGEYCLVVDDFIENGVDGKMKEYFDDYWLKCPIGLW